MEQHNLFDAFQQVTKDEWIAKVNKDLKGKPFDSLNFEIEENLTLPPFYHVSDAVEIPMPNNQTAKNDWLISEVVEVKDVKSANQQLLDALMKGVNAPCLVIEDVMDENSFEQLMNAVEPTYITLNFKTNHPIQLSQLLNNWLNSKAIHPKDVKVNINGKATVEDLAELIKANSNNTFRLLPIHTKASTAATQIADILHQVVELVTNLEDFGISSDEVLSRVFISIGVGRSYFLEIAKLRALKWLWSAMTKAYNYSTPPYLQAHSVITSELSDTNTNMIRATTQAMSAVIGGVNELTVTPSNSFTEGSNAFTRRIARNVQHLLIHESHFDYVKDPSKGSYYIEQLSKAIGEQAWALFLNKTA